MSTGAPGRTTQHGPVPNSLVTRRFCARRFSDLVGVRTSSDNGACIGLSHVASAGCIDAKVLSGIGGHDASGLFRKRRHTVLTSNTEGWGADQACHEAHPVCQPITPHAQVRGICACAPCPFPRREAAPSRLLSRWAITTSTWDNNGYVAYTPVSVSRRA